MKLTWLIVIILIAMIGIWWWQDHNAQQKDLLTMANQNDLVLTQQDTSSEPVSNVTVDAPLANNNSAEQAEPAPVLTDAQTTTTNTETDGVKTIPLPNAPQTIPSVDRVQADATQTADMPAVTSNGLTLNFSGQCWLEIRDANNKVLFSGMKNSGDKLELDGAQPYRLNIGAPANVTVQFQGKDVDLSRFIKAKRSAKFKLPEA